MPSWELFEEQDQQYRESVLPKAVTKRLAVETGVSFGWCHTGSEVPRSASKPLVLQLR